MTQNLTCISHAYAFPGVGKNAPLLKGFHTQLPLTTSVQLHLSVTT